MPGFPSEGSVVPHGLNLLGATASFLSHHLSYHITVSMSVLLSSCQLYHFELFYYCIMHKTLAKKT